jgi:CBS domain-containing protein
VPETKKVGELMLPLGEYPEVYDSDTLKDAIKVLRNYRAAGHEHRSLLVFSKTKVDNEEQLVGILTTRDILKAIKTNRLLYDNTELFTMSWAFFYRKDPLNELTVTKVGQAIRPLVDACVQAGDTVVRAIELRMTKNVNCCPFLREEKLWGLSGP